MPYVRTNWVNDVTPLSATNMNNIEVGIEEAKIAAAEALEAANNASGGGSGEGSSEALTVANEAKTVAEEAKTTAESAKSQSSNVLDLMIKHASGGGHSWDDIRDRPFYAHTDVYYEYEEGVEPLETVVISEADGTSALKVSEEPLTMEQLVGCLVTIAADGISATLPLPESEITDMGTAIYVGIFYSVFEDTTVAEGVVLTPGFWLTPYSDMQITKIFKETVEMIPSKYLTWDNLQDRPFYEINETYYQYTEGETPLATKVVDESSGMTIRKVSETPLTVEQLVGATVEGVANEQTTQVVITQDLVMQMGNAILVGDGAVVSVTQDGDVNGIALTAGLWVASVPSNVTKLSKYELVKIPDKYLPEQESGGGLPEVTAEDNGKFMGVVDGAWAAVAVTNGNEVAY